MKKTHVTIEEFEAGTVTDRVSSLDQIKVGEAFIAVWREGLLGPNHEWPVFERAAAGCVRRETGKVEHISDYYEVHKIRE